MKQRDRLTAEGILYTDQYQLTMAQLYFRLGFHERQAQFEHFFRNYPDYGPHQAGYCINAGMPWLLDWVEKARFRKEDMAHLRSQKGSSGKPVFQNDFLEWLQEAGTFNNIALKAIPEGRVVHPNVPLAVVQGPLAIAQILETPLLNFLNYQILVATKASRIRHSARGQMILDFGLRRGQERGSSAGIRAALIGGVDFTSAVGVSHVLGFSPKGTHAHSMVQVFMALGQGELDAFEAYADIYPDDCLLLVDTVNTLESGLPNAIKVFEGLRRKGHKPFGVRLDSGDLAYLSIQAARMMNDAGFTDTVIVLSNQLDEMVIRQIMSQIEEEAAKYGVDPDHLIKRLVFGVGTRLVTSQGASALDGVYKLVAVEDKGEWRPAIKISESLKKIVNPGPKQVWRIYDNRQKAVADLITTADEQPHRMKALTLHHPTEEGTSRTVEQSRISKMEPLLTDTFTVGLHRLDPPQIDAVRARRTADVEQLDSGVRRMVNPHIYHVSLSEKLWRLKRKMVESVANSQGSRKNIPGGTI